jgi:NAD(P)-dependent dehydrogenase (short-subunit alcohol dehydrogenase family)
MSTTPNFDLTGQDRHRHRRQPRHRRRDRQAAGCARRAHDRLQPARGRLPASGRRDRRGRWFGRSLRLPYRRAGADRGAVRARHATHGRLDILVNNAATNPYFGSILDTDPGIFQKTVDVNIRGYFYMSTHGAKLMAANGGGAIVNVASVNGVVPGFQQGIYSITKAAVISMTKAFAVECAEVRRALQCAAARD